MVAWLQLRAGAWDEAERAARAELGQATTVPRLLAETVVCELAVRRGDADAADRLARPGREGRPRRGASAHRAGAGAGDRMVAHAWWAAAA